MGRTSKIAVGDQQSSVRDFSGEVPKGSVLSHMLFNLYVKL